MLRTFLTVGVLLTVAITLAHEHGHGQGHGHGHGSSEGDVIRVETVMPGSAAEAAGVRAGDQLIALDGRELETLEILQEVIAGHQPGDTVPLTVLRDGEEVELSLTFGDRSGAASVGVRMAIETHGNPAPMDDPRTTGCLDWIEETYKIETLAKQLDLDLTETYAEIRQCVSHDTTRMSAANAKRYCDNVFKVHCSGVDLLTDIGEAQVGVCEERLNASLGLHARSYKGWKTCGQHKVFDRYSRSGETSDVEACKTAFLDECATNIDAAVQKGQLTAEQQSFVDCCSADAVGSGVCGMIERGFSRGPCRDQPVCVNRLTSEWLQCSALN